MNRRGFLATLGASLIDFENALAQSFQLQHTIDRVVHYVLQYHDSKKPFTAYVGSPIVMQWFPRDVQAYTAFQYDVSLTLPIRHHNCDYTSAYASDELITGDSLIDRFLDAVASSQGKGILVSRRIDIVYFDFPSEREKNVLRVSVYPYANLNGVIFEDYGTNGFNHVKLPQRGDLRELDSVTWTGWEATHTYRRVTSFATGLLERHDSPFVVSVEKMYHGVLADILDSVTKK